MSNARPGGQDGRGDGASDGGTVTVTAPADVPPTSPRRFDRIITDRATVWTIKRHVIIDSHRRHSKALDRFLGPSPRLLDPWRDPDFLRWHRFACDLAGIGRGRRG